MVCKKNNFINHSWLIGGNRVGFVTCRFIIFVFDGPVFQFVNCLGLTQDLRFRSVACHLLSLQKPETRVFRNSVDAFYCVLTKEDLCNLCMQQVLPYLETSIPKCSLVCRCFLWWKQNVEVIFHVKKKGGRFGGSEAEIQNWILPTEEGTRGTTGPTCSSTSYVVWKQISFPSLFCWWTKSCPQIW